MLIEAARRAEAAAKEMLACINAGSAPCTEVREALAVSKAQSMRPEQFTKEARRWAADRQHDGGEADYRRLRARRYVRIWDSDDGTVELHSGGRELWSCRFAESLASPDALAKSTRLSLRACTAFHSRPRR